MVRDDVPEALEPEGGYRGKEDAFARDALSGFLLHICIFVSRECQDGKMSIWRPRSFIIIVGI